MNGVRSCAWMDHTIVFTFLPLVKLVSILLLVVLCAWRYSLASIISERPGDDG